jgi:hypothetical protein
MNLNPVEQAKQRILSINWTSDDEKEGSHRLLFSEFLRRAALIAKVVGILDTPRTGWPLLDYAIFFDASLELEDEEIEALARKLQVKGHPSWYAWSVCVYFIHWVAIQEHPTVMHHQLLNPYEPLIMLYERGGYFRRDKIGTWEFASTAYFIGSASSHLGSMPVADLKDETSLNRADEAFKD